MIDLRKMEKNIFLKNDDPQKESEHPWDLIIKPKTGWFDIHLGEIWRYRDLIGMFIKRDFVTY